MASQCPKCHQPLDEDYVCCAGIEFQWRCSLCQKRTRGFAIPFGKCLCGGDLIRLDEIEQKEVLPQERVLALQEAFQIEVNAHLFYRHLADAVEDPQVSDFFETMSDMEKEHAQELNEKYHLHLKEESFQNIDHPLPKKYFESLRSFADTGNLRHLYDCAIDLEKGTLNFFLSKSDSLSGKEKELYLELAAEEREHIAMLESERDR